MASEKKIVFDEPKTFGLAKLKLYYSAFILVIIIGTLLFDKQPTPTICFAPVALLALYLFLPFTYKLIVSNEAISSINLFGARTLEWHEIAGIENKNGNLRLTNRDGDIKIIVNQQLGDFPEIVEFIKQKRPELWATEDTKTFHQNIFEATLLAAMGFLLLFGTLIFSLEDGFSFEQDTPAMLFGLFIGCVLIWQGIKIREITFDIDYLVAKYLIGERRIHVHNIQAVNLQQRMVKNEISYPVHIQLTDGKQLVIEKTKEGNPILVNAIETWLKTYKGK